MKIFSIVLLLLSSLSALADCPTPSRVRVNSEIVEAICVSDGSSVEFSIDFGLTETLPSSLDACRNAGFAAITNQKVDIKIQCIDGHEVITDVVSKNLDL